MSEEKINNEEINNEEVNSTETDEEIKDESAAVEENQSEETSETDAEDDGRQEKDKKKKDKHDKYKEEIAELNDKLVRQLAEFENYRNRTQKEKDAMFETGAKSVIEKILPVVDNFERAIDTLPEDSKEDAFAKGVLGIYKQLMDELDKMQVKPIEALGKEFDPALHNAVMQTSSDEYESGVVAQELQKGYTYRDQVVRHSMVAVVE